MEQQTKQPFQEQRNLPSGKNFLANPKLPLIMAAVVVILAVGGILLLREFSPVSIPPAPPVVQQTPSPTPSPQPQTIDISTWQTYRNEEYGFEIKYPLEWNVSDCIGRTAQEGKAPYADIVIGPYEKDACMVAPYVSSPELAFALDINEKRALDKTCGYGEELQKKITIANKEAPLCGGLGPGPGEFHVTSWVDINGKLFLFWGNSRGAGKLGESHEEFQGMFEQILSTFRFVE